MDQQAASQVIQSLDDIQKKIADTLGIADSIDEKHLDLVDKATDVLLKEIFLTTIEKLPDEDAEAYAKLIEEGAEPEEIRKFLDEKIPDYKEMTGKIVEDFLRDMKEAGQQSADMLKDSLADQKASE